jgi:chemotaxis signal transduction protein
MTSIEPVLEIAEDPQSDNISPALSFTLGNGLYSVDPNRVAEIIQPLAVTALPNLPPAVRGVAANRGEIIALLDLSAVLGSAPVKNRRSKWLVFRVDHGLTKFAVEVENVNQVIGEPAVGGISPRRLDIDRLVAEVGSLFG